MVHKASVLIVDDNSSFCRSMSLVLKAKGYAVSMVSGGLEALEKVKEASFDMIFMDVKMPDMDGVEAYRRIKQVRPGAVVAMMTGYAVEDLVEQAVREGARDVLYKPLDIDRVTALIDESTTVG
jgi:DNA-binding NtrC family response regulator